MSGDFVLLMKDLELRDQVATANEYLSFHAQFRFIFQFLLNKEDTVAKLRS